MELETKLRFWRESLSRNPAPLQLRTDSLRGAAQTSGALEERFSLESAVSSALSEWSRTAGTDVFTVAFCAWIIVLAKWSRQKHFVIGLQLPPQEASPAAGASGTLLALSVSVPENVTPQRFVRQIHATLLSAIVHSDVPFELVCQSLLANGQPEPDLRVVVQKGKFCTSEVASEAISSTHELWVSLTEEVTGVAVTLLYSGGVFGPESIRRLVSHWNSVVRAIIFNEPRHTSHLSLLSDEEREQVLYGFNGTRALYPNGRLIHDMFEYWARETPDSVALLFKSETLTYGELDVRSNQLARHMLSLGVGPEDAVGVCLERSLEMVLGLLAVLKAGGVYVPLDPSNPTQRLRYVLEDCRAALVLTQAHLRQSVPAGNIPILALDSDWNAVAAQSGDQIDGNSPGISPGNTAYIIYTSGSTGNPKGVMVEHQNATRFLSITRELYQFPRDINRSLFHSFAFDVSVFELWGALSSGAKLVIVPYAISRFPRDLYRLLANERVALLNQTPSAFRQLVATQDDDSDSHNLGTVILAGEALQVGALRHWLERNSNRANQCCNMYGPTETTVYVTHQFVKPTDVDPHGGTVIGSPIPHSRIYILDEYLQPVPIGVVGEIYIGGTGVARGYLNRPDLTADRFLCDPFTDTLGARIYRSGDLGIWRSDGTIVFLGRNDSQVKVRGFRIELGEIESHLSGLEGVREVAVVAKEDFRGEAHLVAYLTTKDGAQLSASSMRTALLRHLPVYMVPHEYVILPQMPLNVSGKLDRRALCAPVIRRPESALSIVEA